MGWDEIVDPDGWFALAEVSSGGKLNFNFGDAGEYVVMIHAHDAQSRRFDRVFGYCESS